MNLKIYIMSRRHFREMKGVLSQLSFKTTKQETFNYNLEKKSILVINQNFNYNIHRALKHDRTFVHCIKHLILNHYNIQLFRNKYCIIEEKGLCKV